MCRRSSKERAQPVGLKRDEGHGMAVPHRVEPHEPSGRRRRPECIQEVGVKMVPLLREEDAAAGRHYPGADVVTEHDGVDEVGSGRALPLRHRHRGGNDRRSGVPADDVRPIDFFAVAGGAVGQGGVGSGRPKPGTEDSRFRRPADGGGIPRGEIAGGAAPAETRAGQFIEDDLLGAFLHVCGNRLDPGRCRVFRHGQGQHCDSSATGVRMCTSVATSSNRLELE